ncbi:unnamed protein product [Linum tenue]|uniref:CASP-like protein n=1 Tax=Linum tenue TaxID=586396 RepID=A0AAV0GTL2_9ROSI|nr:unnamed protein product [Linum tenue]
MASTTLFTAVFVLDFVAFLLALAAEQTRSTAKVVIDSKYDYYYCVYDSNIATILGAAAFGLLLAGQFLTCFFLNRNASNKHRCRAVLSAAICWTAFLGAEACLLVGSVKNAQRTDYRFIFTEDARCETLRFGVFQGGAAFIMVSSFASKLNGCWSEEEEEEEGAGAGGDLGAYTPI